MSAQYYCETCDNREDFWRKMVVTAVEKHWIDAAGDTIDYAFDHAVSCEPWEWDLRVYCAVCDKKVKEKTDA